MPWDILWQETIELEREANGFTYRYVLPPPIAHCDTEPAVEYPDGGAKCWFQHGVRHRVNGPAIDFGEGHESNRYYIRGKELSKEEYERRDRSEDAFPKEERLF